jgi:hypothetical protein
MLGLQVNWEIITGDLSASSIDLVWQLLGYLKRILLTSGDFSHRIIDDFSYTNRFTHTLFRGSHEVGLPQVS